MKTFTRSILIFLFVSTLSFSLCALSFADIPHLINYQGKLTDKDNKPVADGTYSVTFKIYDAESGPGTMTPWVETQSVSVSKGIFSVMLGGVTALNLAFDKPYWLGVKVGSDTEMTPRQRIASTGYAIRSESANNADKVSNIEVSLTPQPNRLLPLDANAKLPMTAMKVYDSGWFVINANQGVNLTHNLGTTKIVTHLYYATDASGAGMREVRDEQTPSNNRLGGNLINITPTTFRAQAYPGTVTINFDENGHEQAPISGYYRVIAIALE